MKKLVFVFLLACALALCLSACNVTLAPADKTTVPPCEHEYSEWIITVQPSCTAQGLQMHICSLCQEQEWLPMDKLAHTEVIDEAVAPTCTETGLTEGKHCSACGEVFVAQLAVDALGHTEVIDTAVAPTCTKTGLIEGKHCSACGEVFVAQETIPAKGHEDQNNDGICDICTTKFASIGLAYTLSNNGTYYSVSSIGNCKDTDIFIPLMHNGLPVKEIAYEAFYNCDSLNSVVIPDSVTSIGEYAFYSCDSLTGVVIGDSVTSIGDWAFSGCYKLVEVINYSTLDIQAGASDYGKIGYYAKEVHKGESKIANQNGYLFYTHQGVNYLFGYTGNERDLILPENDNGETYEIYQHAFSSCDSLTSVVIGDSATSIGYWAFYACHSLTGVVIGDGVTSVGDRAFSSCGNLISVVIGDSVTSIGDLTFYNCGSLTSVVIPDSVTSIGKDAFSYCTGLTSVVIPDSVTSIGDWAFYHCYRLTSVVIPDSVTSIGEYAFYVCSSLADVYYTGTAEEWAQISIGNNNSDLTGATIHYNYCAHIEVIDAAIAPTCTKTGLTEGKHCSACGEVFVAQETIPAEGHDDQNNDGVCDICITKFVSIGLAYTLSDDGTYYSVSGIGNCKDTDIFIPLMHNGLPVKEIAFDAFCACSRLTSVVIPDSVTSIGEYAFDSCDSLTKVVIPDSVTSIGEYAFSRCDSLTGVVIGNSVTSIEYGTFFDCDSLTSVVIPNSVTSIGGEAFAYCTGLTSVVIPDSVTSIEEEAFCGCRKLVEVINHSALDIQAGTSGYGDIGYYAKEVHKGESKIVNQNGYLFYTHQGVNYLLGYSGNETDLILPQNYKGEPYKIYQYAFYLCDSLTSVVIPDSVTSIGGHAFYACHSLTGVVIGNSVTSIGEYAFYNCDSLTDVVIPDRVTSIGKRAFSSCDSLISVVIPDNVTTIGEGAFYGCSNLTHVYYTGSAEEWAQISISSNNNYLTGATIHYDYVPENKE